MIGFRLGFSSVFSFVPRLFSPGNTFHSIAKLASLSLIDIPTLCLLLVVVSRNLICIIFETQNPFQILLLKRNKNMDMNLARRLDDDSSPSTVETNFKKLKSPSQRISRSNDRNSRETDSGDNLVSSMSTKSPRSKNSLLLPSSIDPTAITPRFTREKEGPGLTQSTRTNPSHPSSTTSSKELFRKKDCFRNLLHGVLTKAVASALTSTTSSSPCNEELHEKVQQSLSGVGREGEFTNMKSGLVSGKGSLLQKLVQEKQTDCLILQQKIDSKNSEIAQLQSVIETLRETKKQQATNIERLRIALRRASKTVTTARYECFQSEICYSVGN